MELKPCPFCGGMAMELEKSSRITPSFHTEISATIQCVYCGANIKKMWYEKNLHSNEQFLNNETVYDLWNRRSEGVVEVVRCKNCEHFKAYSHPLKGFYGQCLVRECNIGETDFCSYGKRKEGTENE